MFLNRTYTIPLFVDWHVASGFCFKAKPTPTPIFLNKTALADWWVEKYHSGLEAPMGKCGKGDACFRGSCSASQKARMVMVKLYTVIC